MMHSIDKVIDIVNKSENFNTLKEESNEQNLSSSYFLLCSPGPPLGEKMGRDPGDDDEAVQVAAGVADGAEEEAGEEASV